MALLELTVTDLALIDRARLTLGPGLTVITGETGAGKSLVIDALLLVTGGRADASLVRAGASAARVEALFDRPTRTIDPMRAEADPGAGDDRYARDGRGADGFDPSEPLICVREIGPGRTVARIDDGAVPVARLQAIAGPLVAVHGQHEQQRLLAGARQRELLDAWGGHGALLEQVATAVVAWRDNQDALAALDLDPAELERRRQLAAHAVEEIGAIEPRVGEVAELRARLDAVAGAERFLRTADALHERLVGDGGSVRDLAAGALHDLRDLARHDPTLEPHVTRLEGLEAEAVDLAAEIRAVAEHREADQAVAAELEVRLGALYGLLRKYGDSEEEVLAHAERAALDLEHLDGIGAERERRLADDTRLRVVAEGAAAALRDARRSAAAGAGAAITAVLTELGFPDAAFQVAVADAPLTTHGADEVTFLLAPNPGEPARPLGRIASGGELSRVSLAIEQVLASADTTPTLVFDEVDAGIGGRSADPVGRSLWRLGRAHQVLCVTHLPQVAAHADTHLHIAKESQDGRTVTRIRVLTDDERVEELAAMLAGAASTTALEAARELLTRARHAHGTAEP